MLVDYQHSLGYMYKRRGHLFHGINYLDHRVMDGSYSVVVLCLAADVVLEFEPDYIEQMHCLPFPLDMCTLECDSIPYRRHLMHKYSDMDQSIFFLGKLCCVGNPSS